MRQDRRPNQKDVVCKMPPAGLGEVEVFQSPRLARELSCCWQDNRRRGRGAKPVQQNALNPELRCCLQDDTGAASGRGAFVADGFAPRRQDASAGIASNNPDCGSAIFVDCRGTPRGIRDRRRSCSCDNQCGAFAGTRLRHTPPGGVGTSMAGKPAGSSGNTVHPYKRRCLTPAASTQPVHRM
jgi:hypothetical protein